MSFFHCRKPIPSCWLAAISLSTAPELAAQSASLPFNPRTTFDKAPWVSARASGLSEAISPIANGQEAAYYNPAAIGGLYQKPKQAAISDLYFPYLGGAADSSSVSLYQNLQEGRNIGDPEVASELLRAFEGEYQYARVSMAPSITVKRMIFAYTYDVRAASTPNSEISDSLDVDYRTQSGPLVGMSFASSNRTFYLGLTATYVERKEMRGTFPLVTMTSQSARQEAFRGVQQSYQGAPLHLGTIWHMPFRGRPTLALVMKDLLGTTYKPKDSTLLPYKDPQKITLGFALSPQIASWGMLNWVLEADDLANGDSNFSKKFRTGAELTLGNDFGSRAGVAFRLGYSYTGASYGLGINLGMLGLHLASSTEDIGVGGERVLERRSVVNFGINIAD